MRGTFFKTLAELALQDQRILLLTGDLGYMSLEPFSERFPDRFINVGVAEQNMVGVATGLAEAGFIPFIYSIAPFVVLRPYEFIRNGPVLHQFQVRIVSIGGGLEYGHDGASHYGLEDIGVLRIQPNLTIISPADYQQAAKALLTTWDLPGPVYYRLGKDDKSIVPGLGGHFELGRAQLIGQGSDLLIITMGNIAGEAALAVEALAAQGISSTMMVIASISPPPIDDLVKSLTKFPLAVTIEAHYITGGLGSLVAEVIADQGLSCRIVRCGIKGKPNGLSGSQDYMWRLHGLSAELVASTALGALRELKHAND